MTTYKHVKDIQGKVKDTTIQDHSEAVVDGSHLTLFPGLIDPHVHFRTPGAEHKEDWKTGARAALAGGITTVFDMPNNQPACTTADLLKAKKELIQQQLKEAGIDLRYYLYFGADKNTLTEIPKVKNEVIGIKVFMGCSTGDLLIDDDISLHQVFKIAAENDMLVSVHAEDETLIHINKQKYAHVADPRVHSLIRNHEVAKVATTKAIACAREYKTRLCILHMSTADELDLVKRAKDEGLQVYAEVAPHHLLFSIEDYEQWGTLLQMNPSIKTKPDNAALWEGIRDGSVDFIGTDHAPHTLQEKKQLYGKAPSGVTGVELVLPLMLSAYHRGEVSLGRIVELMRTNIMKIFRLTDNDDKVLVDLNRERVVRDEDLETKVKWSPYRGMSLKGWPVRTYIK